MLGMTARVSGGKTLTGAKNIPSDANARIRRKFIERARGDDGFDFPPIVVESESFSRGRLVAVLR
jgi:hypothetical protein